MALSAMGHLLAGEFGWDVGALEAHFARLASQTVPASAELAAGLEEFVIGPVTLMSIPVVGVFSALGAGYMEARDLVRDESTRMGFAGGFVMGLLGWNWNNVKYYFGRHGVIKVYSSDEALNVIRVNAYNKGLAGGWLFGSMFSPGAKKAILGKTRRLAGHPSAGHWTRNDKISFVMELATTVRTKFHWT